MIVGSVCLSHSPLKDRTRPSSETEARFNASLEKAGKFVAEQQPDLVVIFYPDHINGFFYGLLPPFCIGIEGISIGDYGTAAGELNIPAARAADLSRFVLDAGVDAAISHKMQVDHGAVQPLEWLSADHPLDRVIPIFVNCAAPPLPTFERARALGRAVGDWARQAPERILLIGSGGLSHDPPMAELANATPQMRERLISGAPLNHAARFARQSRAATEGNAMAVGKSRLLPANAEWDRKLLDAFLAGNLSSLDDCSQQSISEAGGRGGHEARTWVAALSALGAGYCATEIFYEVIDEWITGMGILTATSA
ncbi:2,3-dihydroxyphenylpropionate 1,2-dioxygenase [Sphingobium sp. AP50]|uniref:3-carboxyethylcatechol 2,3-dioxygenase n=1 Tax=Sphingobium sp. AP50 TaxID=1884369 RepID=UPI0008B037E7|nr:3-carboxyethylcatechol 2,3-dioxygenase [Sphingobium sp. AP50]SEK05117.1 2,3-dihydroxyphenylpropionate 1,2-dioxygenase [Sphingobium sp. AP50]